VAVVRVLKIANPGRALAAATPQPAPRRPTYRMPRWGLAFLPLYADANLAIYDLAVPKFAGGRDRRLRTCPDLAPLLALLARQWPRER
jgi:hypothetical protein